MSAVAVTVAWAPDKVRRPTNGVYSTLARFGIDPDFEHGAWSVTLRFDPAEMVLDDTCAATAEFLASKLAPLDWLKPGATFEMMEGRRVTAHVVVR